MFNLYSCLKRKKSESTISVQELIEKIKSSNSDNSKSVQFCRALFQKGTNQYDDFKTTRVEAFSANCFNSINYRNAKFFKSSGFIYIDIDNFISKEQAIEYRTNVVEKLPFVYACWLSLSETGLSILVKVDKCNQTLYNKFYDKIKELKVFGAIDEKVIDYKRLCCVSYDASIYVNLDAVAFDSLYQIEPDYLNWRTVIDDSEFENINTPAVFVEGKEYCEINVFKYKNSKIKSGKRTSTIGAISLQLIYLNPQAEFNQLLNGLLQFNRNYCEQPLTDKEVFNILKANFNKKGSIEVSKYLKSKQVFFHRNCQLNRSERLQVINECKRKIKTKLIADTIQVLKKQGLNPSIELISEYTGLKESTVRSQIQNDTFLKVYNILGSNNIAHFKKGIISETTKMIYSAIEDLQDNRNKITQQRIAEYLHINVKTVKRNWLAEFKSLVSDYNRGLTNVPFSQVYNILGSNNIAHFEKRDISEDEQQTNPFKISESVYNNLVQRFTESKVYKAFHLSENVTVTAPVVFTEPVSTEDKNVSIEYRLQQLQMQYQFNYQIEGTRIVVWKNNKQFANRFLPTDWNNLEFYVKL